MNPTIGPKVRPFLDSVWRTLQMGAIALTPWSLLALAFGPVYYRCWWFSHFLMLLPFQLRVQLSEDMFWCEPKQMSDFEFYLLLSGVVWIPVLSLSVGWVVRKWTVKRLLGVAGAILGLGIYFSVGPTFVLWVAGKT